MILLWCYRGAEIRVLLRFVILTMLVCGALPALPVHAETTIVPSATVRTRYDSNVYRRPKQLIPSDLQPDDFVTSVGASLNLLHQTRDIVADVKMAGFFNAYVENTNLNFFSALLQGHLGLDHWVDQYVRGARLSIVENLRYTPEQPSFLTGPRDLPEAGSIITGIVGFRAPTTYNTTEVRGAYPLSRDLSVEGGYIFGYRSIGQVQGGLLAGVNYFNTMVHTWQGGPRYQLTRNDSIAALYRQSFITQEGSQGGRTFNTNVITLAGDYTKKFLEWDFAVQGGVTFIEPGGRAFASGSLEVTTQPEKDTAVRFGISREARPSYYLQGGVIIANIARFGISHKIYERLMIDGTVAYGLSEYFPNTDRSFKNLTATSRLAYKLTRNITGEIFYLYQNIDSDASSIQYQFSRHEAGLLLSAEWK